MTNLQMSNGWSNTYQMQQTGKRLMAEATHIGCNKRCIDKHCNNKPTNIQRLKRHISDATNIAMTKFAITNQQTSNGWSNKYQMRQTPEWQTDKHPTAESTHIRCNKCWNDKPTNIQRLKWHKSDATNVAMTNIAITNQQMSNGWSDTYRMRQMLQWQMLQQQTNKPTNVQRLKQHISDATNVAMTNIAITNQQTSNSWSDAKKRCNDKRCNNKPTNVQRLKQHILNETRRNFSGFWSCFNWLFVTGRSNDDIGVISVSAGSSWGGGGQQLLGEARGRVFGPQQMRFSLNIVFKSNLTPN